MRGAGPAAAAAAAAAPRLEELAEIVAGEGRESGTCCRSRRRFSLTSAARTASKESSTGARPSSPAVVAAVALVAAPTFPAPPDDDAFDDAPPLAPADFPSGVFGRNEQLLEVLPAEDEASGDPFHLVVVVLVLTAAVAIVAERHAHRRRPRAAVLQQRHLPEALAALQGGQVLAAAPQGVLGIVVSRARELHGVEEEHLHLPFGDDEELVAGVALGHDVRPRRHASLIHGLGELRQEVRRRLPEQLRAAQELGTRREERDADHHEINKVTSSPLSL